jgi:Flp pilus assembly protein TadB
MISRMFKTERNQRYDYIPRYYDPEKEALQERINQINKAKEGDLTAIRGRMRDNMRRQRDKKGASKQITRSSITFSIVLVVLMLIAIAALSVYLPEYLEYVLGK